jgi:hypothetical protein
LLQDHEPVNGTGFWVRFSFSYRCHLSCPDYRGKCCSSVAAKWQEMR